MAELQQRMSSAEFAEWLAFEQMDPGEPRRGDYQFAHLMCLLANINRPKKRSPFKVDDFLLRFRLRTPIRKAGSELKLKLLSWAKSFDLLKGGK